MIKHVKNVRFAIAKLAFWHEALLCGIGHQNGWKKYRPFWALTKLWFTWYGLGGYSCKSPYKYSTDTLRWYATYVETSHFTLCFHKQNKGSLILHGICTNYIWMLLESEEPWQSACLFVFFFRACVFIVFSQSKLMCGEFSLVFPKWIQDIVFVSTSVLMTMIFLW